MYKSSRCAETICMQVHAARKLIMLLFSSSRLCIGLWYVNMACKYAVTEESALCKRPAYHVRCMLNQNAEVKVLAPDALLHSDWRRLWY
jgi:hypothetical protein